jgi:3-oxoacyl-[acyl-carrier protein] reductase
MTDLSGKVALITGSARGIGRAIALRYGSLGADIVVNYSTDETNAEHTVLEIRKRGVRAVAVKADVADTTDLEQLFSRTIDTFGKVDIVVANAGVELQDQPLLEVTEDQFDRFYAINTKGAFFTLQKAGGYVADGGRIIYVGSSSSYMPLPGVGLYGSSKMAPRYVVEVLAQEIGHRGVTVNAIMPTTIEYAGIFTDITDDDPMRQFSAERPIGGRMGTVNDVADAAEYFAGELAGWVSGQQLLISGGARV